MLHFPQAEFDTRRARLDRAIEAAGLDALLLFAPESQYWLTGYDTFGYCHFQCLIVAPGRDPVLLTRSADRLQAALTSTIRDVRIWTDTEGANPAHDLALLLAELGLGGGARLGAEYDTHGLTAHNYRRLIGALETQPADASDIVSKLRLVKSEAELVYVRRAGQMADAALEAALPLIRPGGDEAAILAELQGQVFRMGGDYPANEVIIGSGDHALLCRYQSGRRTLAARDQITLEWAGVDRHYHVARMLTVPVGEPRPEFLRLHAAASQALTACEAALTPDRAMGDVFAEHARVFAEHGLGHAQLNACGYALGTRFAPSWMEREMFYQGASTVMRENMVFFLHMVLMDTRTGAACCLGRTSIVRTGGAECLSRHGLEMVAA